MPFVPLSHLTPPAAPWSLRRREVISASPGRVWKALVDPEEITRWWSDFAEVDPRPGGRYLFGGRTVPGGGASRSPAPAKEGRDRGRFVIEALEPEARLEFQWPLGDVETRVAYELVNILEETELTVTQTADRAPEGMLPPGAPNWWWVALPALRSHVETGEADLRIDYEAGRRSPRITFRVAVTTFPWIIWHKLSEPLELERWWAKRAEADLRPGGAFRLGLDGMGPREALEVDPGMRLLHDWTWPDGTRGTIEWTIAETEEETLLSVTDHGPWPPGPRDPYLIHWAALLLALKRLSERGIVAEEAP